MESVVLKAVHPTWLNTQLPIEVADLIQYDPRDARDARGLNRGVAFLARGPGVARVIAPHRSGEILAIETVLNRYLATARLTDKLVFNLPEAVVQHLGLKVQRRGADAARSTDDGVVWFLPAPEYYEFRARARMEKRWVGPSTGGPAHVYLARSVVEMASGLEELERRIEIDEWRPRLEAWVKTHRSRRTS